MKKFYFFKIAHEENAQGQLRTVAHPLPGQTTSRYRNEGAAVAVDPDLKVQFANAENAKVVRLNSGTVIGICKESGSWRDLFMPTYHRGETSFYRVDEEVFFVESIYGHGRAEIHDADDEMMQAYRALTDANQPQATPAASGAATAPTRSTHTDNTVEVVLEEPTDELSRIEETLMEYETERDALDDLLTISIIRDRLRAGIGKFTFQKQNGDTRVAYGTRRGSIIERSTGGDIGREGRSHSDGRHFAYFDIQRNDWRCFCVEDIMSVDTDFFTDDPALVPAM